MLGEGIKRLTYWTPRMAQVAITMTRMPGAHIHVLTCSLSRAGSFARPASVFGLVECFSKKGELLPRRDASLLSPEHVSWNTLFMANQMILY